MFISPAFAQDAGGAAGGGLAGILPLILIFVVFYFLLIRPQQKKMKQHKDMLKAVRRGDKVVTSGGIIATVAKVHEGDDEVTLEIAEGVKVRARQSMIAETYSKPQPAQAAATPETSKDDDKPAESTSAASKLKGLLGGKKD